MWCANYAQKCTVSFWALQISLNAALHIPHGRKYGLQFQSLNFVTFVACSCAVERLEEMIFGRITSFGMIFGRITSLLWYRCIRRSWVCISHCYLFRTCCCCCFFCCFFRCFSCCSCCCCCCFYFVVVPVEVDFAAAADIDFIPLIAMFVVFVDSLAVLAFLILYAFICEVELSHDVYDGMVSIQWLYMHGPKKIGLQD